MNGVVGRWCVARGDKKTSKGRVVEMDKLISDDCLTWGASESRVAPEAKSVFFRGRDSKKW